MTETLLTEIENKAAEHFMWKHRCKLGQRVLQLIATPTGLGLNIEAKCLNCGKKKDISDYESW